LVQWLLVPTHTPSEFDTFTKAVEHILSVPKSEILRREEEYRRQAALNPHKRGPKPKVKRRRSSPGPAA
jgi:hypothetical protein